MIGLPYCYQTCGLALGESYALSNPTQISMKSCFDVEKLLIFQASRNQLSPQRQAAKKLVHSLHLLHCRPSSFVANSKKPVS